MNGTQALRSTPFRNSIKATIKDLATTNKAYINKHQQGKKQQQCFGSWKAGDK